MLDKPNQEQMQQHLLAWFRQFRRDLPWRRTKDPYGIWVSEIMLQQTRVAAVIPYYGRFLARFPDVNALAAAPQEEVLRLWSGLGYYSRARNLQRAAQQIVANHHGEFPLRLEDALQLPGIGAYTAAAILSIAYGEKLAVLDGNVARVLTRLNAIRGDVREPRRWSGLQEAADSLLDKSEPGNWNQAVMELGATLCTPLSPQCLLCPVAEFCKARQLGIAEKLPEKRRKRDTVEVSLAAAVFLDRKGRTLLLPPPLGKGGERGTGSADHVPTLVSRMWHFPTIAATENPETELRRGLQSLIGEEALKLELVAMEPVRHAVTYRHVRVFPFAIACGKLPRVAGAREIALDHLSSLPVSNLTRKVATRALASVKGATVIPRTAGERSQGCLRAAD